MRGMPNDVRERAERGADGRNGSSLSVARSEISGVVR